MNASTDSPAVTLSSAVLGQYGRLSLYNSPFVAHDRGCAVDLYPGDGIEPDPEDGPTVPAPSPVAGEVVDVRTVTAPDQPYAADDDHLLVVDTGSATGPGAPRFPDGRAPLARILHVDPAVEVGDRVAVGDRLGRLVRAGFFAPWVANHLHLGFRPPGADTHRASGSLPLELDPSLRVEPLAWDGTGTVVAPGDSYAVLDAPTRETPGEGVAGIAATGDEGAVAGVLDGGFPHYDFGGLLAAGGDRNSANGDGGSGPETVGLSGTPIGRVDGRTVAWDDLTVLANGRPVRGIALCLARERTGAKLVGADLPFATGEEVTVEIVREG